MKREERDWYVGPQLHDGIYVGPRWYSFGSTAREYVQDLPTQAPGD